MIKKILSTIFFLKSNYSNNLLTLKDANFKNFNDDLEKLTGTKLELYFTLRCNEIFKIIQKFNIKTVIELGTGRSTYLFNCFNNIEVFSVEQNIEWMKKIIFLLDKYQIKHNFTLANVIKLNKGAKFNNLPPLCPDLLYIDGPYYPRPRKKFFNTFGTKPAYFDFETFFKKGCFPKIIMIEGRISTVEEINKSEWSKNYFFQGSFVYNMKKKKYHECLRFKTHSMFIRKF